MTDEKALAEVHDAILFDVEMASKQRAQFEKFKASVLKESDVQTIGGKPYITKSGWRIIAMACNITDEIIDKERGVSKDGGLTWIFQVRAKAPNGRSTVGIGLCSNRERGKEQSPEHVIMGTAHTRAKSRAISDLVGGGEVSAEELQEAKND